MTIHASPKDSLRKILSWGFVLWLFGYVLGILLFPFVRRDTIGFWILPFGTLLTLWVAWRKISSVSLRRYVELGMVWMIMAVVLDYLGIVKALHATAYYKPDVFVYYALTLLLPIAIGWYKASQKPLISPRAQ